MVRNIPLYLLFLGMLLITTVTYVYMDQALNSFVIFACTTVAAFFFFNFEPVIYFILLFPTSVIVEVVTIQRHGIVVFLNVLLFILLIILCILYKWRISIADFKFNVEYNYEDLNGSNFSSYEKHLIFRYKYLEYPITSFNKKEKEIIKEYLNSIRYNKPKTRLYTEAMYEMPFKTIEANSRNSNIQYVKEEDLLKIEEREEKKEIKSQILKSGY